MMSQSFRGFKQDVSVRNNKDKIPKSHQELNARAGTEPVLSKERFKVESLNGVTKDIFRDDPTKPRSEMTTAISLEDLSTTLDVDSAQIINLALNLSESRRVASSRTMPLAPNANDVAFKIAEGMPRSSIQRWTARNSLPKLGGMHQTPTQPLHPDPATSTIQIDHNSFPKNTYRYQFSPSTLARAEKAKTVIELMAHYRSLLQFVPPLKPALNKMEGMGNTESMYSQCTDKQESLASANSSKRNTQLGRSYNLLQYIRNRKLRARTSKSFDGEAQGFGDVKTVSKWVEDVSKISTAAEFRDTDNIPLPKFPIKDHERSSLDKVPYLSSVKNQEVPVKVKRPRIDWIISPADLIADLYWLEQDDNKKLIEDRNGNTMFSDNEFRRPNTSNSLDSELKAWNPAKSERKGSHFYLAANNDTTGMRFLKSEDETYSHTAMPRVYPNMYNLHNVNAIQRVSESSNRSLTRPRARSRSKSQSLSSDEGRGRRRLNTRESQFFPGPLYENQIHENATHVELSNRYYEAEPSKKYPDNERNIFCPGSDQRQFTSDASLVSRNLVKICSPNSQFPEAHDMVSRDSRDFQEYLSDSTAPNSPQIKSKKLKNSLPGSKTLSPQTPKYVHKKADERDNYDNINRSISVAWTRSSPAKIIPEERSFSSENLLHRLSSEGEKGQRGVFNLKKSKTDSERISSIRGLLKNVRNPVSRLSDFLWRRDSVLGNSILLMDGSDTEYKATNQIKVDENLLRVNNENTCLQERSTTAKFEKEEMIQNDYIPPLISERSTHCKSDESSGHGRDPSLQQNFNPWTKQGLSQMGQNDTSPASSLERPKLVCSYSATSECPSSRRPRSVSTSEANTQLNAILDVTNQRFDALSLSRFSVLGNVNNTKDHKWWNYNHRYHTDHGLTTNRQLARVKTLLLSSGIKAKEIRRRAGTLKDIFPDDDSPFLDLSTSAQCPSGRASTIQRHRLAARMLSDDIKHSTQILNSTSEVYLESKTNSISNRLKNLQAYLMKDLTPMTRTAVDEADAVSRDLVIDHRIAVTQVADKITQMMQRRRARFRWLGRGGWVMVEWTLIGIMWCVWFIVIIIRSVLSIAKFVTKGVRWLFWL